MNDDVALDVLMAVYLIRPKDDFDGLLKLAADGTVAIDGVILLRKNAEGAIEVADAGDQSGRRPKATRKLIRHLVGKKVGDELDEKLPRLGGCGPHALPRTTVLVAAQAPRRSLRDRRGR